MYSGMLCVGSLVSGLSSCRPSFSGWEIGWRWGEVVSLASMLLLLKHVPGLLPRSSRMMGNRPPFVFCSS